MLNTDYISVKTLPSPRQIAVEELEFYAFAHFTVNTFTDREWGDGTEDEAVFNPTEFDAAQWVRALKAAGIKGLILTCKHHDGFCLWPSEYTEHSVKNSPYKGGRGDIVREVSDACRAGGLKFGVYLSPWDRNNQAYGDSDRYNDYFVNQLTELCKNYGRFFSVWFDGACGEGPNGKKQVYDWERFYNVIRAYQPDACISICGPDIRWCGNEAGDTRQSEWSVIPTKFLSPEEVAAQSQTSDDAKFREKKLDDTQSDLGSRKAIENASEFKWHPAEVDTSIRPGWFYHASEDGRVRSVDTLFDIYMRAVGGNCTLLLNIPPDRRGLFHENDVAALRGLGEKIRDTFALNFAVNAAFDSDSDDGVNVAENARCDGYDKFWKPFDGQTSASLTVRLSSPRTVSVIALKENIRLSQRVERFRVIGVDTDGGEAVIAEATTIGYKRILRVEPKTLSAVRIEILDSRVCPTLSFVGIY